MMKVKTNWAFLRRMTSQVGLSLIPDSRSAKPVFSFGPVIHGSPCELESTDYTSAISERYYVWRGCGGGAEGRVPVFHSGELPDSLDWQPGDLPWLSSHGMQYTNDVADEDAKFLVLYQRKEVE